MSQMNVVGRVSSFITQGVSSVATPFHPFGGAVDIIVVKQHDGTFRSTPWYVRFGKFQGVLKGAEKVVRIEVNGVEANFHMHLNNSGEAYFVREVAADKDDHEGTKNSDILEGREDNSRVCGNAARSSKENVVSGEEISERDDSDSDRTFYEFQDEKSSSDGSDEFLEYALEDSQISSSEVVLVSVDGHMLKAPISSSETATTSVQLSTRQFPLGLGDRTQQLDKRDDLWTNNYIPEPDSSTCDASKNICKEPKEPQSSDHLEPCRSDGKHLCHVQETVHSTNNKKELYVESGSESFNRHNAFKSCLELTESSLHSTNENHPGSVSLLESEVEAPTQERNTSNTDLDVFYSMPVPSDSNNQEPVKQAEVEPIARTLISREEYPSDLYRKLDDGVPRMAALNVDANLDTSSGLEISLCGRLLHAGMGLSAAQDAFNAKCISLEEFRLSPLSIMKNKDLIVRIQGKYFLPWHKVAHIVLGIAAFGVDISVEPHEAVPVEQDQPDIKEEDTRLTSTPSSRWRLWPNPFRSYSSNEEVFDGSESGSQIQHAVTTPTALARAASASPEQIRRTNMPTSDEIASLNLKEGQNMVSFKFSTRVLGWQKVEAHIYLWKWDTKIVISDVDGTITKSDVLGQVMPLVGRDWTHTGIAHLFSAIKENGYQLLFLSARAIVQASITKSFLFNLKQDGKSLPNGPVVISPDGLFPSFYREVIKRAPHEFKITCLENIKALFPPDYNPFYAGFGNRHTDELSYRKIGIPEGKIFIINPKGEVAINRRIDVKSYTSLHTLVHDMFPPTSLMEQEEFNSWNYWKLPLPHIHDL